MAGKSVSPRIGKSVKRQPGAFPLFCDGRKPAVVTADPWAFLRNLVLTKLPKEKSARAIAYLDQAKDFFDAGASPRVGSKPLLYYYALLNLAKMALVTRGMPLAQKLQHGLADPRANSKKQIKFSGQNVNWPGRAHDKSEIFPELLVMLSGAPFPSGSRSLKALLRQIPTIHRTFCLVTGEKCSLLPISKMKLLQEGGDLWARVVFKKSDAEIDKSLARASRQGSFKRLLSKVQSANENEIWYETRAVRAVKKGIDNGIRNLAQSLAPLAISAILTGNGYRRYLSIVPPAQRLPQIAAVYAVMFYLGSITRYRPHDFERIVRGGESWIVAEYLASQPIQILHLLASFLDGRVVHKPYAVSC